MEKKLDEVVNKWCRANELDESIVAAMREWGVENMEDLLKLDVRDLNELRLTGKKRSQLRKAIERTLPNSTLAACADAPSDYGYYNKQQVTTITENPTAMQQLPLAATKQFNGNNGFAAAAAAKANATQTNNLRVSYQETQYLAYMMASKQQQEANNTQPLGNAPKQDGFTSCNAAGSSVNMRDVGCTPRNNFGYSNFDSRDTTAYFSRQHSFSRMSVNEHDCGNGAFADWPSSFASRLARHHKKIQYGSRNDVILLSKNRVSCPTSLNVAKYLVQTGEPNSSIQKPVILLLGKTGAGKSTFINYLVNIVLGVKVDDPFRFLLVNDDPSKQTRSVTNNVTVYDIPACDPNVLNCGLVLIDTPGFADTQGRERDQKIAEDIKQLLMSGCVSYLHKIVFVASATECRLTPETFEVIEQVKDIFASDISDNIEVVLAKADSPYGNYDDALKSLSEAGLPVLNSSRLNQSVLYQPSEHVFTQMLWEEQNGPVLTLFLERLLAVDPPNYLHRTQEKVQKREQLVSMCEKAKEKILFLASQEVQAEATREQLQKREVEASDVKKSSYCKVKIDCSSKSKALNCNKCKSTCHKWCKRGYQCHFLQTGICKTCGCQLREHSHESFFYGMKRRNAEEAMALINELTTLQWTANFSNSQISENRKLVEALLNQIVGLKKEIHALSMHTVQERERTALSELLEIDKEIMKTVQGDGSNERLYRQTLDKLKQSLQSINTYEAQEIPNENSYTLLKPPSVVEYQSNFFEDDTVSTYEDI